MKKPKKNSGLKYWFWYNFGILLNDQNWRIVWVANSRAFYRNNITGFQNNNISAKMILKVDDERKIYNFYITDSVHKTNLEPEVYFNDRPDLKRIFEPYKEYKNIGSF